MRWLCEAQFINSWTNQIFDIDIEIRFMTVAEINYFRFQVTSGYIYYNFQSVRVAEESPIQLNYLQLFEMIRVQKNRIK